MALAFARTTFKSVIASCTEVLEKVGRAHLVHSNQVVPSITTSCSSTVSSSQAFRPNVPRGRGRGRSTHDLNFASHSTPIEGSQPSMTETPSEPLPEGPPSSPPLVVPTPQSPVTPNPTSLLVGTTPPLVDLFDSSMGLTSPPTQIGTATPSVNPSASPVSPIVDISVSLPQRPIVSPPIKLATYRRRHHASTCTIEPLHSIIEVDETSLESSAQQSKKQRQI